MTDDSMAAVLAQALRLGLRHFETTAPVRSGPVPPEVQSMRGALQQYERAMREAKDAQVVPATGRRCRLCGLPIALAPCGPTHAMIQARGEHSR